MAAFVAALRQLAEHCDYKDILKDMLRDRLVCGVNHEKIQKALLAEPALMFDQAFAKARAMETAEINSQEMQPVIPQETASTAPSVNAAAVHRLQRQQKPAPKQKCYHCQGGGGYAASTCRFREFTCGSCGGKRHIARACRSTAPWQCRSSEPQGPLCSRE